MLFKTHLLFSFNILLLYLIISNQNLTITYIILTVLASFLPDIDKTNSKLGRHFKLIGFISRHRGLFHSIWFAILLSIPIYIIIEINTAIIFLIIYISHLILDSLTKKGIRPFYPFKLRIKGNIKVGKFKEKILFIFLIILLIIQTYTYFFK